MVMDILLGFMMVCFCIMMLGSTVMCTLYFIKAIKELLEEIKNGNRKRS